jgi:hypothetical protein
MDLELVSTAGIVCIIYFKLSIKKLIELCPLSSLLAIMMLATMRWLMCKLTLKIFSKFLIILFSTLNILCLAEIKYHK